MSICRIHGDRWSGVANHEWHIDAPTLDDLERAVLRLDAVEYTLLTIETDGEQHMAIGGGAGRYVVYATFDNEEFWNLLSREPKEGVVLLNAGGQEGDYPAKQIVSLDQALAAGREFFGKRRLDPAQTWDRQ